MFINYDDIMSLYIKYEQTFPSYYINIYKFIEMKLALALLFC